MDKKVPQAIYGSQDHPLKIVDLEIPCYVLDDGRRVLVRTGMIKSLGMSEGTGSRSLTTGDRLVKFISGDRIKPYISSELAEMITKPLQFKLPGGGLAYGYEATILPEICDAVLTAREKGVLQKQQSHIAKQCEILVRGFARIGIIALVDEVTGYQTVRSRQALEEILEKFITKELRRWAKTFPDEFYEQMFRLRDWQYQPFSVKRPQYVGTLTNDIVYERLAPGVLEELKRITPRDEKGRTKHRFFQRPTEDVGHPRLREHLTAVIALMRASTKWDQFYRMLQRALPRYMEQQHLEIDEKEDE